MSELDNPVWHALSGPQRDLGTSTLLAARFHPLICPFAGFAGSPGPAHWADMASLLGPAETAVLLNLPSSAVLSPWIVVRVIEAIQMVGEGLAVRVGNTGVREGLLPLRDNDVPDMLALVAEAQPGPFLPRTIAFGGYLGVRRGGGLVAMAGQRLGPTGYTEISAVATRSDHRRRGLAGRLVHAVAAGILERGDIPFLHVSADNSEAIRLYEDMGFSRRTAVSFTVVQIPLTGLSPG